MSEPSSPKLGAGPSHRRSASVPVTLEAQGVLRPVDQFYDAEAQRISNIIDEGLKVS